MTQAYPLHWPEGFQRTAAHRRARARFDVSLHRAIQELVWEVERMGGTYPLISSNRPLRRDGLPKDSGGEPADPGIAVYFQLGTSQKVFACDRWDRVRDNIRAISKTIEALRGIERWGVSEMLERTLEGFEALPPPKTWRDFFGDVHSVDDLKQRFRELAKKHHPDNGGSEAAMAELNAHYDAAIKELRG